MKTLPDLIEPFTSLSDDERCDRITTLKRKRLIRQFVKEKKKIKTKTKLTLLAAKMKNLGITL